jgi:hypothetical protein
MCSFTVNESKLVRYDPYQTRFDGVRVVGNLRFHPSYEHDSLIINTTS